MRRRTHGGRVAAFTIHLARGLAFAAPLSLVTFAVTPAVAQVGVGVITGTVIDAQSKRPVPNAVVTASSPAMQGEQIVLTDAAGNYRIPNLPTGDYSINLQGDGFKPFGRGGIRIQGGATIRVNVSLLPENVKAEEVVVVAKAPTVDVGSSSTGTTLDRDFLTRVPLSRPTGKGGASRSFESVADVAPGAQGDTFGVSIAGATSPENRYMIDGLAVNDPAYGIVGTPLSVEFMQEVQIVDGGFMPEYGRSTGGVLVGRTKHGSNDFHGSVFGSITPGALEGTRETILSATSTVRSEQELRSIRSLGFDVGGPLIKDKLWFYAGFQIALSTYRIERYINQRVLQKDASGQLVLDDDGNPLPVLDANEFPVVERIPGSTKFYDAEERAYQYVGKLTWAPNADNSFELTISGAPTFSGGDGRFSLDPQQGGVEAGALSTGSFEALAHRQNSNANDIVLSWARSFDKKNTLLDVTLGWHHQYFGQLLPVDGSEIGDDSGLASLSSVTYRRTDAHPVTDFESVPTGYCDAPGTRPASLCPVSTYFAGGPDFMSESSLNRYQARAMVTNLRRWNGAHVIKGGFDGEIMHYGLTKAYSGGQRFRESTGGGSFSENRQYGYLTAPDQAVVQEFVETSSNSLIIGGFAQDSWTILDKVTLNAGLRYDAQYIYGDSGNLGMALPNQISPRVGVIFDPTQSGKSKIFANYARYFESVPLDVADRALSGEQQIASIHSSALCNPSTPQGQADCRSNANGSRLVVNGPEDPNQYWIPTGAGSTPIDPDLKPQSQDEIVVGGEYEVIPDGRVGLTYKKRWVNNIIEDMSRDDANTYFIGNPGSGIASDFPEPKRDYDAVTAHFTKTFSDRWLAQASYTLSYLRGNWAGLFRPETGQLDPNINADFDLKSLTVNREGPLPGDSTHQIKVFGAYDQPLPKDMALQIGLGYRASSGGPTSYLGSDLLYGADEVLILPRGEGERLPWVHRIDLNLTYALHLAKESTLSLTMDVFNLFNFQAVTATDERYTASDVAPVVDGTREQLGALTHQDGTPLDPSEINKNFGNPTSYQSPRSFRFGARVTF